jgi:hypothetical protein
MDTFDLGQPDRRGSERVDMVRPLKVYDPKADRFFPGRTSNVSAGGALLCIRRSMPIQAGDRVDVGIAGLDAGDEPMRLANMRSARVVRVSAIDALEQAVAVHFNEPSAVTIVPEATPSMARHAQPTRVAA